MHKPAAGPSLSRQCTNIPSKGGILVQMLTCGNCAKGTNWNRLRLDAVKSKAACSMIGVSLIALDLCASQSVW